MHMTRHDGTQLFGTLLIAGAWLVTPSIANAQGGGRGVAVFAAGTAHTEILNVEPMGNVPTIAKAPFTADATTEFTQILSDGNRIDRRFTTSLARDGRGRTRPQKDSEPPRFTVITDPVEGVTYTLDERLKQARRSGYKQTVALHAFESAKLGAAAARLRTRASGVAATGGDAPVVESLGTRQIEGVAAEGTRSTTTIPAGQIGNLNPIQLVTERWFSKELQMAVLLTRRDPRSGDTVYRLTNIVRAEPPPDLFTVPADYRVVEPIKLKSEHDPTLQLELNKLHEWHRGGQQ
jgi:hypothetical protein